MGRPPKLQRVDYFPHMSTHHSKTLYVIEDRYGNDGYAFWFKLLETLAATNGHALDLSQADEYEFLLARAHVVSEKGDAILDLIARLGGIDQDLWTGHRVVWCQNLVDNLSDIYKKRNQPLPEKPSFRPRNPSTDEFPAQKPEQTRVSAPESAARIGQDRIGEERTGKLSLPSVDKNCQSTEEITGTPAPSPESIITPRALDCFTENAWTETLKHYPDKQTDLEEAREEFRKLGSGAQNQVMRGAANFGQSKRARDGIGIWSLLTFIRKRKFIDWQKAEQPLGGGPAPPDTAWKDKADQWQKEREEDDRKRASGELPPIKKEWPWQKTATQT